MALEHPDLKDDATLLVKRCPRFGRHDFEAKNGLAKRFLVGLRKATLNHEDLKWIQSMGYTVLETDPVSVYGATEYRGVGKNKK